MKKLALAIAMVSAVSSFAHAGGVNYDLGPGFSTSVSLAMPFMTTSSPTYDPLNRKIVYEAREDINYFVASQGEVRTARFEQAMKVVRSSFAVDQASDMELAQAVLAEIQ